MERNTRPASPRQCTTPTPQLQTPDQQTVDVPAIPIVDHAADEASHTTLPDTVTESSESRIGAIGSIELHSGADETLPTSSDNQPQTCAYKPISTDDQDLSKISTRKNHNILATTILADCAIVILPLAVIGFSIAVWCLDGAEVGNRLKTWQDAINVLATSFPILFASVIGRLISSFARWKLEKGERLGLLEQLMGSRTVGSTVVTLFQLQTWNALTALLLIIWIFSPVGSQAILRMLQSSFQNIDISADAVYFDTQAPYLGITSRSVLALHMNPTHADINMVATLYTTLVTAPKAIKIDTMDMWGNVRIPRVNLDADGEWKEIPEDRTDMEYTSLTGIPILYAGTQNMSFPMDSSYIHLDCPESEAGKVRATPNYGNDRPYTAAKITDDFSEGFSYLPTPNGTWRGYNFDITDSETQWWSIAINRLIDPFWMTGEKNSTETDMMQSRERSPAILSNETGIQAGPTKLLLRFLFPQPFRAQRALDKLEATCDITQRYVDSRISCTHLAGQRTCRVQEQKLSRRPHAPKHITHLSFPFTFEYMSRTLPAATGRDQSGVIDPTIYYLKDPTYENISRGTDIFMDDIDLTKVGTRFSQLLNTYLTLSQLAGRIADASTAASFEPNITSEGETTTRVEVFAVSKLWMWLCIVSGLVLTASGILSVVFTHLTNGPEILGYVSTTIRNSRSIEIPSNTTWMDGIELTKEMKELRIRYGTLHGTVTGLLVAIGHEEETEKITVVK